MIVNKTYQQARMSWILVLAAFVLITIVLAVLGLQYQFVEPKHLWVPFFAVLAGGYFWWRSQPSRNEVSKYIHQYMPTSEYSLDLLEKPTQKLNTLEAIQVDKINAGLKGKNIRLPIDQSLIKKLGGLVLASIITLVGIHFVTSDKIVDKKFISPEEVIPIKSTIAMPDSITLLGTSLRISSPSYTATPARSQSELDVEVLEGSRVQWNITWSGQEEKAELIYEEDDTVEIENKKNYGRTFYNPSYYRYKIAGTENSVISPYASIKVIQDEPSQPEISGIEEYQRLEFQENYDINFDIAINDDQGIEKAHIIATVAKGQGESVKFREKKFELKGFVENSKTYNGIYAFSTKKLAMEPGDELYFHVVSKDNCPYREQWSKSPTHFVMLEDTATYFFAEDQGMQVDLMPDFFRSQRQIIIDSEKLLAEKKTISTGEFNKRSNELGFDQKQLRLKYGQFLGEESESGIAIENEIEAEEEEHDHDHDHEGEDHDHGESTSAWSKDVIGAFMHDHDHEDEELLSSKGTENEDPAKPSWVEELSHKHDNREEASFHQLATKSKLRAALSEMWDAELHLRLYDPETSLPYQNKSLLLLQEIKNHARIYVHRIGFDPPKIKEAEQRLSGDLDEIASPTSQENISKEKTDEILKGAYQYIADEDISSNLPAIEEAANVIASQVVANPNLLPLLTDLQTVLGGNIDRPTLNRLKVGLAKLLDQEVATPTAVQVFNHPITSSSISELRKTR